MDNLIVLKIAFVICIGAGAAVFAVLSVREPRRSFERWAGLLTAVLFGTAAFNEAARVLAMLGLA